MVLDVPVSFFRFPLQNGEYVSKGMELLKPIADKMRQDSYSLTCSIEFDVSETLEAQMKAQLSTSEPTDLPVISSDLKIDQL